MEGGQVNHSWCMGVVIGMVGWAIDGGGGGLGYRWRWRWVIDGGGGGLGHRWRFVIMSDKVRC